MHEETGHEDVLAVVEDGGHAGQGQAARGEAERGENKVERQHGKRIGEATFDAAHVEGERDREHDQGEVVRQEKRREDVHVGLETRTRD